MSNYIMTIQTGIYSLKYLHVEVFLDLRIEDDLHYCNIISSSWDVKISFLFQLHLLYRLLRHIN